MNSDIVLKISQEQAQEMPMVDLAFEVLKSSNTPFYYRDLMQQIARIKQLSEGEVNDVIAHLYTEINIDGRFACVGNNLWGLKRWYPLEKSDDAVGNAKRPRIINDEDDDEDEELFPDEEETSYDVDDEDFDTVDEDQEELFDESDADEDADDEEDLEDEEIIEEDEEDESADLDEEELDEFDPDEGD